MKHYEKLRKAKKRLPIIENNVNTGEQSAKQVKILPFDYNDSFAKTSQCQNQMTVLPLMKFHQQFTHSVRIPNLILILWKVGIRISRDQENPPQP